MTSDLVFDLETIRLQDNPGTTTEDRVPAAPHHRIVSVGRLLLQDYRVRAIKVETEELAGVLSLVRTLSDNRTRAVTWGGRRFDLPVLGARCIALGIPFPRYFAGGGKGDDFRYRYAERPHLDLMDMLADHGGTMNSSLDAYSRLSGMPGTKGEIDGGNVARLYEAGDVASIVRHNLEDLVSTASVYLRLLLVRGTLTPATYIKLAADLLEDAVKQAPELGEFVERVDRARLLGIYTPPLPAAAQTTQVAPDP